MQGWIKLHRQIVDNEFWFSERFTKAMAWIDLMMLANHKPNTIYIRGNEVKTARGELCYSMVSLAKRWKWNERTVDKFLKSLENRQMIQSKRTAITTITTIINYNQYQGDTEQNTEQTQSRIQTNKNDKNEENDNVAIEANNLFEKLKEQGVVVSMVKLRARLRSFKQDYDNDALEASLSDAVSQWGKKSLEQRKDFLSYWAVILKDSYSKR